MRLGIGANELELGDDSRKAGVGRYVLRTLETLLDGDHGHELIVFHRAETPIPDDWRTKATFVPEWTRTRAYGLIGRDLEPLRHRLDAWWSLGGRVPRLPVVPRVSFIHDVFFLTEPGTYPSEVRAIHTAKARAIARHADLIATNSEHTRGEVIAHLARTPESVFPAPIGLGNLEEVVSPEMARPHVPFARYVFSLSTLEPRKNFPRLLQAWAIAAREPDLADVGLVVGGGKGWETADLEAEIARLGLTGRVHFAGYVPDHAVPHLFAGCEAFVLPSLIEGFGITVLEAMHYGAPVACAATGSLPEVAGDLAAVFDPYDPSAMAEAILTLVREEPDARRRKIEAGFDRAREFSWERHVRTVLDRIESFRRSSHRPSGPSS